MSWQWRVSRRSSPCAQLIFCGPERLRATYTGRKDLQNKSRPYTKTYTHLSLPVGAAHAAGFCLITLWISLFSKCHERKCGAAHLDLLYPASHASCFTTSVFGTFSGCNVLSWGCLHNMLNMIVSNMSWWWIILSREILIGCSAVMENNG